MPNLRDASLIGRDEGDRSYAAQTVGGRLLNWATSGNGEVLDAEG